jgi:hypothetical protein
MYGPRFLPLSWSWRPAFFNFIDRVADAFGVELDALLKTAAPLRLRAKR